MYKQNLAVNYKERMICHKSQPTALGVFKQICRCIKLFQLVGL